MRFSAPEVPMIVGKSGAVAPADAVLDTEYWCRRPGAPLTDRELARALADADAQLALPVGPDPAPGPVPLGEWPDAEDPPGRTCAESVAGTHEAGLPVSFAGMFAGERRRRISLPGYPFQRRRHWVGPAG